MSSILTAAAAVMAAVLGGWVGYRFGTRRIHTLTTALAVAVRTATTDPLTGLANRRQLHRHLVQLDHDRQPFTVAIANIDQFATANQWGYRVGDQLLVLVAAQLRHTARQAGGTVYRLAGDEFAIVLPITDDPAGPVGPVTAVVAGFAEPVELEFDNRSVWFHVSLTAGVATGDRVGGDPTARLLGKADTASQWARHTARGTVLLWQPGLPVLPRSRRDARPRGGER